MNEYGLFSKDVALKLEINSSTLRQWYPAIEKEGYEFEKNDKGQRIFYERDINMLFEIKSTIKRTNNRDNSIKAVVSRYLMENNAKNTPSVSGKKRDKISLTKDELQAMLNAAAEQGANNALEKFNHSLEQRDRLIVNEMLDSMEQRRLELAAAQEQEDKKGFWSKLFKK